MLNPVENDMRTEEIDRAFQEMSVDAPVSKENARLFLATESAQKALNGQSNVFDGATYIRISLYELSDLSDTLNSHFARPRKHCEQLQNNYNARRS